MKNLRIAEKVVPKAYITLVIVPDESDFSVSWRGAMLLPVGPPSHIVPYRESIRGFAVPVLSMRADPYRTVNIHPRTFANLRSKKHQKLPQDSKKPEAAAEKQDKLTRTVP